MKGIMLNVGIHTPDMYIRTHSYMRAKKFELMEVESRMLVSRVGVFREKNDSGDISQ